MCFWPPARPSFEKRQPLQNGKRVDRRRNFSFGLWRVDQTAKDPKKYSKAIKTKVLNNKKYIIYEKPTLKKRDLLNVELKNFIEVIKNNEQPIVDGVEARNALQVAIQIQDMIIKDIK